MFFDSTIFTVIISTFFFFSVFNRLLVFLAIFDNVHLLLTILESCQLNFGLDNEGLLDGSTEDCLYLNVYVPANTRNNSGPLPVAGRLILLQ